MPEQKNVLTGKSCSPFMAHASRAVIAEKNGDFQKAAGEWQTAFRLATKDVNYIWASSRMEFCNHAVHRGWGVVSES